MSPEMIAIELVQKYINEVRRGLITYDEFATEVTETYIKYDVPLWF